MKCSKRPKISLIGGGNIGGSLAYFIAMKAIADVVIFDVAEGVPQGKALDISQAAAVEGIDVSIIGTNEYQDIQDSDVIIVTAGVPRKPGMSRDDLLSVNSQVITKVAHAIKKYAESAFVIVITNPLDAMVYLMLKESGLQHQKIVGMAGVLDAARFGLFLAQEFQVSLKDVNGFVLGGHGDSMVPLIRYSTIKGIPVPDLIRMKLTTQERIDAIVQRTRNGGAEIVNLLKTGSAYYAPANAAMKMAESYLHDQKQILYCAAYLNGEYGLRDMHVGVPVLIGSSGVEKIIELDLTEQESIDFNKSADAVRALIQSL